MIEKPILFSGEMVRAILDGRKTQTRRVHEFPKYGIGDFLWVRETWWQCYDNNDRIYYAATETPDDTENRHYQKRPSIFLRRANARIILEVVSVWWEMIQDISEKNAMAEGVGDKAAFQHLWNDINGKRGFGWNQNPLVYVYEFKIDRIEKA